MLVSVTWLESHFFTLQVHIKHLNQRCTLTEIFKNSNFHTSVDGEHLIRPLVHGEKKAQRFSRKWYILMVTFATVV